MKNSTKLLLILTVLAIVASPGLSAESMEDLKAGAEDDFGKVSLPSFELGGSGDEGEVSRDASDSFELVPAPVDRVMIPPKIVPAPVECKFGCKVRNVFDVVVKKLKKGVEKVFRRGPKAPGGKVFCGDNVCSKEEIYAEVYIAPVDAVVSGGGVISVIKDDSLGEFRNTKSLIVVGGPDVNSVAAEFEGVEFPYTGEGLVGPRVSRYMGDHFPPGERILYVIGYDDDQIKKEVNEFIDGRDFSNSIIVVGNKYTAHANEIAQYIQSKGKTGKISVQDGYLIRKGSNYLNYREDFEDINPELKQSELKKLLRNVNYKDDKGENIGPEEYSQRLYFSDHGNRLVYEANENDGDKIGSYLKLTDGVPAYEYVLKFNKGVEYSSENEEALKKDFIGTELEILGEDWMIYGVSGKENHPTRIALAGGEVSTVMEDGDLETFVVGGKSLKINVEVPIGGDVKFTINNESLTLMEKESTKLLDGTNIRVLEVSTSSKEAVKNQVKFSLGSRNIVLEDGKVVQLNGNQKEIDGSEVKIVLDKKKNLLQEIHGVFTPEDDVWIGEGEYFTDPIFKAFQFIMASVQNKTGESCFSCPEDCGECGEEENTTVVYCDDSDEGVDYYLKGWVKGVFGKSWNNSGEVGSVEDLCHGDNLTLEEQSCFEGRIGVPKIYLCPNGCSDGACLVEENQTINETVVEPVNVTLPSPVEPFENNNDSNYPSSGLPGSICGEGNCSASENCSTCLEDCGACLPPEPTVIDSPNPAPPSSGGGGGGSGGGDSSVKCTPDWECEYTACNDRNIQILVCKDANNCKTNEGKPSGYKKCVLPAPALGGTSLDCIDGDGDGYGVGKDCLGEDCDDNSAKINPGAIEICENFIDENCDGFDNSCGEIPVFEEGGPNYILIVSFISFLALLLLFLAVFLIRRKKDSKKKLPEHKIYRRSLIGLSLSKA